MHSQSSILGTALLVSAALAAPTPQITTTVTNPIAGWGGASISNTAVNPQAGDIIPPYNPWAPYGGSLITPEGQYNIECSVLRRWQGNCDLDQPWGGYGNRYGNNYGNNWGNNWYNRQVQTDASLQSSETTISKRDTADSAKPADAADAAQWGPGYYGGWGYPRYRPYGYRYSPWGAGYGGYRYPYGGYRGYGGYYGGYPYYYRQGQETAEGQKAENAELTPAAEAAAPAPAADAAAGTTTTVQNSKRQVVGYQSLGGIQPSFTVDNGQPVYWQGGYRVPNAYWNWAQWWNGLRNGIPLPSYNPGFNYVPGYNPGYNFGGYGSGVFQNYGQYGNGIGVAAVPGIAGTFSVEN